jgi:hypothetical protein
VEKPTIESTKIKLNSLCTKGGGGGSGWRKGTAVAMGNRQVAGGAEVGGLPEMNGRIRVRCNEQVASMRQWRRTLIFMIKKLVYIYGVGPLVCAAAAEFTLSPFFLF